MVLFGMSLNMILKVIMINIVLSGDNAVLIALAAKDVPKQLQRKAIFWGTFGAIILRLICAALIVFLMKIPYLMPLGALFLIYIAFNLLVKDSVDKNINGGTTVWSAVRTIIMADFVMSLDNVLAIAGVAQSFLPILIGVLISVPIIVWCSELVMKLMEKFSILIYIGAGILGWTAGEMIIKDERITALIKSINPTLPHILDNAIPSIITFFILFIGFMKTKGQSNK